MNFQFFLKYFLKISGINICFNCFFFKKKGFLHENDMRYIKWMSGGGGGFYERRHDTR